MRLRAAVVEGADACVDVEPVVLRELADVPRGVGDEADLEAGGAKCGQHVRHVVVELEVLVPLPGARDLDRAGVRRVGVPAHAAHDPLGEAEPDLVVVLELGVAAEIDESGVAGRLVAARLQPEPVALAGADVALRPELRSRPREREVDVEEDRAEHRRYPMARSRGVAQPGSALRSGRRGPQFESGTPISPLAGSIPASGERTLAQARTALVLLACAAVLNDAGHGLHLSGVDSMRPYSRLACACCAPRCRVRRLWTGFSGH